jgi:hypothetical protein
MKGKAVWGEPEKCSLGQTLPYLQILDYAGKTFPRTNRLAYAPDIENNFNGIDTGGQCY